MPDTQQVFAALKDVQVAPVGKDVVSAGFVRKLVISGGAVSFELAMTLPEPPPEGLVEDRRGACVAAVKALPDVTSVHVDATATVKADPGRRAVMPEVRHVVAVASGKGGVGKSTTAVNLALALSRQGARVGLLDADIYGPSLPTMLGVSERPEPVGDKAIRPVEAEGLKLMSIGFLVDPDTPMVWRGPMVHGALTQFLTQVEWGPLDVVVVDMPPGTGDAQLTLTQQAPLSGAIIVTTPQQVALIDARKGLKMFEQVRVPVLGLVENMSYFVCDGCGKEHDIFRRGGGRAAAEELGVPFLAEVPLQGGIAAGGDAGRPVVVAEPESPAGRAFLELARAVQTRLGETSAESVPSMTWQG